MILVHIAIVIHLFAYLCIEWFYYWCVHHCELIYVVTITVVGNIIVVGNRCCSFADKWGLRFSLISKSHQKCRDVNKLWYFELKSWLDSHDSHESLGWQVVKSQFMASRGSMIFVNEWSAQTSRIFHWVGWITMRAWASGWRSKSLWKPSTGEVSVWLHRTTIWFPFYDGHIKLWNKFLVWEMNHIPSHPLPWNQHLFSMVFRHFGGPKMSQVPSQVPSRVSGCCRCAGSFGSRCTCFSSPCPASGTGGCGSCGSRPCWWRNPACQVGEGDFRKIFEVDRLKQTITNHRIWRLPSFGQSLTIYLSGNVLCTLLLSGNQEMPTGWGMFSFARRLMLHGGFSMTGRRHLDHRCCRWKSPYFSPPGMPFAIHLPSIHVPISIFGQFPQYFF